MMTTDWVKDLKGAHLVELRDLINKWWEARELPEDIALARVVSLYKKETQTHKRTTDQLVS